MKEQVASWEAPAGRLIQQHPILASRHTLLLGSDPASPTWGRVRTSGTLAPGGERVREAQMHQKTWVLPLPSCVTLGGLLPSSEPLCFPQLRNRGKESFLITLLLWSEHT